jgi:hypothetical protein
MTYHRVVNTSNTTGARSGEVTAYHSSLSPVKGSRCSIFSFLCSVLYIIVCPPVLFQLAIVLTVLRFMASDYPPLVSPSIFKYSNFSVFLLFK